MSCLCLLPVFLYAYTRVYLHRCHCVCLYTHISPPVHNAEEYQNLQSEVSPGSLDKIKENISFNYVFLIFLLTC